MNRVSGRRASKGTLWGLVLWAGMSCGWLVEAAHAASFDCRLARTAQERLICADEGLSALDSRMGEVYRAHVARLSEGARRRVLASQRSWLAFWPRSCSNSPRRIVLDQDSVECARGLYERRIAELLPASPLAGVQAYVVSQYRHLPPTDDAPEAQAGMHQSAFPQWEVAAGREAPRWLGALNAWLDRSAAYGPDKLLDAESTSDVSVRITVVGRELIQAVESVDFYGHGAAHGLTTVIFHHFLVEHARALRAEDVFTGRAWQQVLAQKVLEALREELDEDLFISDAKELVELIGPAHWDFEGPGLQLHFNPYEVAPYARGPISVAIDADSLREHFTELGHRLLTLAAPVSPTAGPVPGAERTPAERPAQVPAEVDEAIDWAWPAEGEVIALFDAARGVEGLSIAGRAGAPVRAAADGRVVYAGAGLRGYGNMVIVKHSETFLSAYAHNRALLVQEGQAVRRGQQIAEMGSSETDRVRLHFEVRRMGRPVDPMSVLPRRR